MYQNLQKLIGYLLIQIYASGNLCILINVDINLVCSAVVCEWLFQLANNIKKQEVSTLSLSDSNDDQTCNVDVYESPEFSDEIGEPHPSVEVIDEKSPHESVMRPRIVKTSLDESQSTDDCKTVSGSSTSGVSRQMDNIPM